MFGGNNGPEVPTVIAMRRDHKHDGARHWRGVKPDQCKDAHRTPFIVRRPGNVKAGAVCDEPLSLTDVTAAAAFIWFPRNRETSLDGREARPSPPPSVIPRCRQSVTGAC